MAELIGPTVPKTVPRLGPKAEDSIAPVKAARQPETRCGIDPLAAPLVRGQEPIGSAYEPVSRRLAPSPRLRQQSERRWRQPSR